MNGEIWSLLDVNLRVSLVCKYVWFFFRFNLNHLFHSVHWIYLSFLLHLIRKLFFKSFVYFFVIISVFSSLETKKSFFSSVFFVLCIIHENVCWILFDMIFLLGSSKVVSFRKNFKKFIEYSFWKSVNQIGPHLLILFFFLFRVKNCENWIYTFSLNNKYVREFHIWIL